MNKALVSVVVRTFNRPERLRDSLRCLRQQTYAAVEVVVVNDGGVDVEDVIHDELCGTRHRSIRNPRNLGRTAALNVGVAAAEGEYLCFLDDDDVVYPPHIRTLIGAAAPQRLPVVYTDVINVTYRKDPRTQEWQRAQEQLVYSFDFERDNFLLANYIPITCLLIRRDCFEAVGPFDESLLVYEDWEFLIRLSRKFDFLHIRQVTGEYRRRDDNSNILEQDRYIDNERVVKRRYREERDAAFDAIFKRTFQQQREIRQKGQQFDQLLTQAGQQQKQLAETQRIAAQLQQQVQRLQLEKRGPE